MSRNWFSLGAITGVLLGLTGCFSRQTYIYSAADQQSADQQPNVSTEKPTGSERTQEASASVPTEEPTPKELQEPEYTPTMDPEIATLADLVLENPDTIHKEGSCGNSHEGFDGVQYNKTLVLDGQEYDLSVCEFRRGFYPLADIHDSFFITSKKTYATDWRLDGFLSNLSRAPNSTFSESTETFADSTGINYNHLMDRQLIGAEALDQRIREANTSYKELVRKLLGEAQKQLTLKVIPEVFESGGLMDYVASFGVPVERRGTLFPVVTNIFDSYDEKNAFLQRYSFSINPDDRTITYNKGTDHITFKEDGSYECNGLEFNDIGVGMITRALKPKLLVGYNNVIKDQIGEEDIDSTSWGTYLIVDENMMDDRKVPLPSIVEGIGVLVSYEEFISNKLEYAIRRPWHLGVNPPPAIREKLLTMAKKQFGERDIEAEIRDGNILECVVQGNDAGICSLYTTYGPGPVE